MILVTQRSPLSPHLEISQMEADELPVPMCAPGSGSEWEFEWFRRYAIRFHEKFQGSEIGTNLE